MSRLLNNSREIREELEARNLYSSEEPYDANASGTVSAINSIVNVVSPFGTFDLRNTVVGRLIGNDTPLARIGLQMLAIQFGRTAASNASAELLPSIDLGNIFDGDPNTKLFSTKKDFQITRRETQTSIGRILEEITGVYPLEGNPFPRSGIGLTKVSSKVTIENTGRGQLGALVKELNRNRYKPSNSEFITALNDEGLTDYPNLNAMPNKLYFSGSDTIFDPFNILFDATNNGVDASTLNRILNRKVSTFREGNRIEYGSSDEFLQSLDAKRNGVEVNKKVNVEGGDVTRYIFKELDNSVRYDLTWGIDLGEGGDSYIGANSEVRSSNERFNYVDEFRTNNASILDYTNQLLKYRGRAANFDLTKKRFYNRDGSISFNGSPLSRENNNTINEKRQHSYNDPYDSYVKAIRFEGNNIYNGNENSVIYRNVIPKITPENGINRNLMFSIENLAVQVEGGDNEAFLVSNGFRTDLPLCEKGSNGGRVMWFPPYDIQLSENVAIDNNTTKFIGRGEPIYTYNNTERMATLSFKLVIDYPPQVAGFQNKEQLAKFFAFGGEAPRQPISTDNIQKQIDDLKRQLDEIKPVVPLATPQLTDEEGNFYFPNDEPKVGAESVSVNNILQKQFYEVTSPQNNDSSNRSLNDNFVDKFDVFILEYLADENVRPFVTVELTAFASRLFNGNNPEEYNQRLSERRIEALKSYIEQRFRVLTGNPLDTTGLFITNAKGAVDDIDTDEASEISNIPSKIARRTNFKFVYNNTTPTKEPQYTQKQIEDRERINEEITALEKKLAEARSRNASILGCNFTPYTINDNIVEKYNGTNDFKYRPVFYSQTPEDFHRRLTFLHQCTRQGDAIRKEIESEDGTTTFSARNSVFGRKPVQILRIGDFFHTKVIIDNMQIDYTDATWDMNPEGMGMQFMLAEVKLQLKVIGGQSLRGPIDMLQNAVSFNYYANSTFYNSGVYKTATESENLQYGSDAETT